MTTSTHRAIQLSNLAYACECEARVYFRASKNAISIKNRSAAAHFFAQGTKALRIAQRASLRIGA